VTIALLPDQFLITLNGLEILAIVYLAIALSKLRERIARMEGENEAREGKQK
jgi:hypothetical protein